MLDQRRLVDAGVAKIQVAYLVLAMMGAVYCSCMILSRERSSQLQKQGAGGGLAARGRVQETSGRWAVRQGEHGRWARTCVRSLGSSGARSPGSSSARSPGSSGDGSSGARVAGEQRRVGAAVAGEQRRAVAGEQRRRGRRGAAARGRRGAAARGRRMRGTGREDLIAKVFKILRGFL
nr:uncharacterized protein LOC127301564 [Lolium perenne]